MTEERKGIAPDQWGRPDAREPRPNPVPDLERRIEAERAKAETLKPCPFCGHLKHMSMRVEGSGKGVDGCANCGARGPLDRPWNTRADPWNYNMDEAPRDGMPVDLWVDGERRVDACWHSDEWWVPDGLGGADFVPDEDITAWTRPTLPTPPVKGE